MKITKDSGYFHESCANIVLVEGPPFMLNCGLLDMEIRAFQRLLEFQRLAGETIKTSPGAYAPSRPSSAERCWLIARRKHRAARFGQNLSGGLTFEESDRELVCVQVTDIFAQVSVQDPRDQPFQHGDSEGEEETQSVIPSFFLPWFREGADANTAWLTPGGL